MVADPTLSSVRSRAFGPDADNGTICNEEATLPRRATIYVAMKIIIGHYTYWI